MVGNVYGSSDEEINQSISEMNKRIQVLENYVNEAERVHNPTWSAFGGTNATYGLMIQLTDVNLMKMMHFEISGNGYSMGNPIKVLVQGYHFDSVGNFISCKQTYLSGRN